MAAKIHPTAVISENVRLGNSVTVGPYAVIEANVEVGAGTAIGAHSIIYSNTSIGKNNQIHAHVVLGDLPQHLAYEPGIESYLLIGNDNIIREMVTMHRALYAGAGTQVGSHGFFMTNSHIAHDCIVGDYVVVATGTAFGGHVEVGDRANIGGMSSIHQFARIGKYSMVAAAVIVRKDVLPFSMVGGDPVKHYRLNTIGLRRNGIEGDRYRQLEKAYRGLRGGEKSIEAATPETEYLQEWLAQESKRGLTGFLKRKD